MVDAVNKVEEAARLLRGERCGTCVYYGFPWDAKLVGMQWCRCPSRHLDAQLERNTPDPYKLWMYPDQHCGYYVRWRVDR